MFKFTSLLPEKEEKLFRQCYSDYGFKRTFDEVARRYDIITLAKKANEKRDEIERNDFIHSTWRTFDGEYFNTRETDEEGWLVREFRKPVYSVRSHWVENMYDALFSTEAKNIPNGMGFKEIFNIRKFRKLINPMSDENKNHGVAIIGMYNGKNTFIGLSLPCDFLLDNWWMRLFYEMRTLEHLNEYKRRFIEERWSERIAYTLYIYRFKYGLHMWRVAQKYVQKRFCKSGKNVSKMEKKICERRMQRDGGESVSTTSTQVNEMIVQRAAVINSEYTADTSDMLNVDSVSPKRNDSTKSISENSLSSDDEDRLEQEATDALFGSKNNCQEVANAENAEKDNIEISIQKVPAVNPEEQYVVPDIVQTVSGGNIGFRKPMSISSGSSSDDE